MCNNFKAEVSLNTSLLMTNYALIYNNQITNIKLSDGAYRCHNLLLSMCYGLKGTCYPLIKYIANTLNPYMGIYDLVIPKDNSGFFYWVRKLMYDVLFFK